MNSLHDIWHCSLTSFLLLLQSLDKNCLAPLRKAYCSSLNLLLRREVRHNLSENLIAHFMCIRPSISPADHISLLLIIFCIILILCMVLEKLIWKHDSILSVYACVHECSSLFLKCGKLIAQSWACVRFKLIVPQIQLKMVEETSSFMMYADVLLWHKPDGIFTLKGLIVLFSWDILDDLQAREFANELRASTKASRNSTVWLEGSTGSSPSVNSSDTSNVSEAYAKMLTIFIPLLVDEVMILISTYLIWVLILSHFSH